MLVKFKSSFKIKLVQFFLKILMPSDRKAILKYDRFLKKYKYGECDIIANHCSAWGDK